MGARYDVVKEYDWTSSPRGSGMRKKAPRVWVKSFKLNSNKIQSSIQGFLKIAKNANTDAKTFYDQMYGNGATTPEDDFNFPFFNDELRSFSNEFSDTFQNAMGQGGGLGESLNNTVKGAVGLTADVMSIFGSENVFKAAAQAKKFDIAGAFNTLKNGASNGGDPGAYVETPMFYQYNNNSDGPLQVSFVLSNTINADAPAKNYNLVQRLTYINRPLRKNSIAVDPPRIYQVTVPGHRFIRWAYCSDFSVKMLGTRREINGVITPEGYEITMAFTSLTLEHAGFMKEATQQEG